MILFVDTVTRSSSPCFELGSGKKYRTYFFLAFSPVFTTDSEKLVGRGEVLRGGEKHHLTFLFFHLEILSF